MKKKLLNTPVFYCFTLYTLHFILYTCLYSASFELLGFGAKAKGMAEAFTAVCNDYNTIYYNPAGLTSIAIPQISLDYRNLYNLGLLRYNSVSCVTKNIGFSWLQLNTTNKIKFVDYSENIFLLAIAKNIKKKFSCGLSVKFYQANSDDIKSTGYGFDIGALYRLSHQKLNLGVNIQNINSPIIYWDTGVKDTIKPDTRLGIASDFFTDTIISVDFTKSRFSEKWNFNLGAERKIKFVSFQLGCNRKNSNNWIFTLGSGAEYKTIQINYGYESGSVLGSTHNFSITKKFR